MAFRLSPAERRFYPLFSRAGGEHPRATADLARMVAAEPGAWHFPGMASTRQLGHRAASGSSVTNCTILTPSPVSTTCHRQPGQPQQARRVISTVIHGPWLSSRCSKTQRGSRSHGPPSFRRAGPWLPGQDRRAGLPVRPGRRRPSRPRRRVVPGHRCDCEAARRPREAAGSGSSPFTG